MALKESCIGNSHELGSAKRLDVLGSHIAHTGTETADQLIYDLADSSLERYLSDNSLRNKLLDILFHILEISVFRAMLHCLKRTHSTIRLEFSSVKNDGFTR